MSKANADIKYDPELPFAYLDNGGVQLYARFKHRSDADVFRERCNFGTVVDTTPKPKIPEDAEFIMWPTKDGIGPEFAVLNEDGLWHWDGDTFAEAQILRYVGDAEVTVLVRKEET